MRWFYRSVIAALAMYDIATHQVELGILQALGGIWLEVCAMRDAGGKEK